MSPVPERPPGANDTDPASSPEEEEGSPKPPWEPSIISRWSELNLADPDPTGALPKGARVPDVLAWALVSHGATDPVEGIVDGVRVELAAMGNALGDDERRIGDFLAQQVRRLEIAMQLLRWTDNRERMPMEDDFDEPPPAAPTPKAPSPSAPADASEDLEENRNAAPSSDTPKP